MNIEPGKMDDTDLPLVTVIITSFNRSHTIERAVNSVLNQSYKNIELVIVDDGSSDSTLDILGKYDDPRICLYKHEVNQGVTAAKNSGLNNISGRWFTIFDSDDEMKPEAIETMIRIPLCVDPGVTAVTCNCWDTGKNDFSGTGLTKDQYIDVKDLMNVCKGIFWGITRTDFLQNDRFNEKLNGFESTLWYKVDDRVKRYYVNAALNILHTDGNDRITKSKRKYGFKKETRSYESLINEEYYLNKIKKYRPREYYQICKTGLVIMKVTKNKAVARRYYELLKSSGKSFMIDLIYKFRIFSLMVNQYSKTKLFFKPYLRRAIKK